MENKNFIETQEELRKLGESFENLSQEDMDFIMGAGGDVDGEWTPLPYLSAYASKTLITAGVSFAGGVLSVTAKK